MKKNLLLNPWLAALGVAMLAAGTGLAGGETWPQWGGPRRDNVSTETGLLKQWPEGGPTLIWTATGCGKGYSSVAVTEQAIYTAGTSTDGTFVIAFDLEGKTKWRAPNGRQWAAPTNMPWARSYDGARATPTVDDGLVYHLNETGRLTAFDARNGAVVWSVDFLRQFGAEVPEYGYTESVLIDGDNLICYPGGTNGYMAALNKKTGGTVWVNRDIRDVTAFSSAILAVTPASRQVVTLTTPAIIGVDAVTGKLLWRYPFTNKRENNIPTPIYSKGYVFASTGYGAGSVLLRLTQDGATASVSRVWTSTELDNAHGGVVLVDGFLYGAAHEKPAWICLDFATGQLRYRDKGVGMGSLTCADGMLYCLGERGTMALVTCTPERYGLVSRFDVPKGGEGMYWAHPVVCGSRLYVRHADRLFAYDVKAP